MRINHYILVIYERTTGDQDCSRFEFKIYDLEFIRHYPPSSFNIGLFLLESEKMLATISKLKLENSKLKLKVC